MPLFSRQPKYKVAIASIRYLYPRRSQADCGSNRRSCSFCIQVCSWLQFPAKKSPSHFSPRLFSNDFWKVRIDTPVTAGFRGSAESFREISKHLFQEVLAEISSRRIQNMVVSNGGENAAPFPLTATDRKILALDDTEFQPHAWDELKQIIGLVTSIRLCHLHTRNI